ncbi:phage tail protein [Providencia rettgeri]
MDSNQATWDQGFGQITMLPAAAGGLPPKGQDFNGILNQISGNIVYQSQGGRFKFSPEYAESIGGYPKGAILQSDDEKKEYQSIIDNNKVNFNTATQAQINAAWKLFSTDDILEQIAGKQPAGDYATNAALNGKLDKTAVVQTTGSSTTDVMSQKAVTDNIIDIRGLISDAVPVGVIKAYIGETSPNDKWLLCRGQAFSAESYPDLAQLLPELKIPDLRGVALRGLDANRGFDPDRTLLSYQEDAMQKIAGGVPDLYGGGYSLDATGAFTSQKLANNQGWADNQSGNRKVILINLDSSRVTRTNTQDETVMKNVAVNFIIKAR